VSRHLIQPEMRVGEADVRGGVCRVQLDRPFEVLDCRDDPGSIERLELQPSRGEGPGRVQIGGLPRVMGAWRRGLRVEDFDRGDEAVSSRFYPRDGDQRVIRSHGRLDISVRSRPGIVISHCVA
jgi:hypothetical protein